MGCEKPVWRVRRTLDLYRYVLEISQSLCLTFMTLKISTPYFPIPFKRSPAANSVSIFLGKAKRTTPSP